VIHTLQPRVDALRVHNRTAECDEALRQTRHPLIAALPDRDALLRVVRYENRLDRQIHCALAELRRRRKPPRGAVCENCTDQTNPFSADTSRQNANVERSRKGERQADRPAPARTLPIIPPQALRRSRAGSEDRYGTAATLRDHDIAVW